MKTSEIRDRLLEERALYLQSVKNSDEAIERITKTIDELDEDAVGTMQKLNIDIAVVKSFDLQRMKQDTKYLNKCAATLNQLIGKMHSYLEGELNV